MNVLITGAQGFVGPYLINLLEASDSVSKIYALQRNAGPEQHSAKLRYLIKDLSSKGFTSDLPKDVDAIIHLAQSNRYREFPEGSQDMLDINVSATLELADYAVKNGISKFIYTSTGNVYQPVSKPLMESDPCTPSSMYGSTKLMAEMLLENYSSLFTTIILRIFGAYGPGQKGMLVSNMIENVRKGNKITLAENKGLVINPIYVDDLTHIFERFLSLDEHGPYEVYNVGGSEPTDLSEIVQIIEGELGITVDKEITDATPTYLLGNINKLTNSLNFTPEVSLKDGIRKCINYEQH